MIRWLIWLIVGVDVFKHQEESTSYVRYTYWVKRVGTAWVSRSIDEWAIIENDWEIRRGEYGPFESGLHASNFADFLNENNLEPDSIDSKENCGTIPKA